MDFCIQLYKQIVGKLLVEYCLSFVYYFGLKNIKEYPCYFMTDLLGINKESVRHLCLTMLSKFLWNLLVSISEFLGEKYRFEHPLKIRVKNIPIITLTTLSPIVYAVSKIIHSDNLGSLDKVFHRSLCTYRTYANSLVNLDGLYAYRIAYRDHNRTHL